MVVTGDRLHSRLGPFCGRPVWDPAIAGMILEGPMGCKGVAANVPGWIHNPPFVRVASGLLIDSRNNCLAEPAAEKINRPPDSQHPRLSADRLGHTVAFAQHQCPRSKGAVHPRSSGPAPSRRAGPRFGYCHLE